MTPAERLIDYFGSRKALAEAFGVTTQAVHWWLRKGLPIGRALDFERKTERHVTAEQILKAAQKK